MRNERGFTLIELMIVVAIVGVLAAISIPAYQNYTVKAKVTEGLSLASDAKIAVEESFTANDTAGVIAAAAAFPAVNSQYVASVVISNAVPIGRITVTFAAPAQIAGQTLLLSPYIAGAALTASATGPIQWACTSTSTSASTKIVGGGAPAGTLSAQYAPANCQ